MLSYRHAFHAGNHADVLKHLVLVQCLEYMTQKPGAILYIDTHAGAGCYAINSSMMRKTGEYQKGAGVLQSDMLSEEFARYAGLLQKYQKQGLYPGSPLLAADLLRKQDIIFLYEQHSSDYPLLRERFSNNRRVKVMRSDGFEALRALLPPAQKRALVLIDPSYEVKSDYTKVVTVLKEGYRRMPSATFLLWYPVVERSLIRRLQTQLSSSGLHELWQFELGIMPDSRDSGMTASGLFVINPPWTLPSQLKRLLPLIQRQLCARQGYYRIENLLGE